MAQNFIPFTNWLLIAFQRHRVVVSEKEVNYLNQPRRSLVYFMRPDLDAQIMCLDGSNKYVPIISGNYVKQKLNATYQYWNPQNLSNRRKSSYPWGFSIDFSISWISLIWSSGFGILRQNLARFGIESMGGRLLTFGITVCCLEICDATGF